MQVSITAKQIRVVVQTLRGRIEELKRAVISCQGSGHIEMSRKHMAKIEEIDACVRAHLAAAKEKKP